MKIKTSMKAGGFSNENQTAAKGVKVKSKLKAGALTANENQTAAKGPRKKR